MPQHSCNWLWHIPQSLFVLGLIATEPGDIGAPGPSLGANADWFNAAEATFLDFLAPDFDATQIAERLADLPEARAVPRDGDEDGGLAWREGDGSMQSAAEVPEMTRMMGLPAVAALGGQVD